MKFGTHCTSHLTSISHLTSKPSHDASRHPARWRRWKDARAPYHVQVAWPRCRLEAYAGGGYDVVCRHIRTACYPPRRKINPKFPQKKEAATPSPSRFSPNPVVLRLIVMCIVIATGRIVRFRPPGRKMKAIPPPPQRILLIFHLEHRATAPSPGRPSPRPGAHLLIVVFLRLATGQSDRICPRGRNLMMP